MRGAKVEWNEESVEGPFNCNAFSIILQLVYVQFDINRLCTRVVHILLLIDYMQFRGSHNDRLRVHMYLCSMLFRDLGIL